MQKNGFTTMELLITIGIASMMFAIVGSVFLTQSRYHAIADAINQTQYQGFQTLDTIGLYTDSAKRVVSGSSINGQAYTTSTSTIILELPSIDASGAVLSNTYDYIALGIDPADSTQFMFDIDAATGSDRISGKFIKAHLIDKLIFRYNTVNTSAATSIDVYVRTIATARNQNFTTSLGKIFHLHSF
jgi:Tfp pilus assembly protein PilW